MGYKGTYDRCSLDNDGDLILMGGHYSLEEAKKIIEEDNYDDPLDWVNPKNIYLKFGFVNFDGEVTSGYNEFDDYKTGRVKATRMKSKGFVKLKNA